MYKLPLMQAFARTVYAKWLDGVIAPTSQRGNLQVANR
jgi:hypothetical protein